MSSWRSSVEARLRRYVCLAPDDGLDSRCPGSEVEVDRPEHVPMVGDGAGGHAESLGRVEQGFEPDGAVEEAELRMEMKVDEFAHIYSHSIVLGGFDDMSRTTRLTPGTSLMILREITSSTS